jgi:hypothetical protein
VLSSRIEGTQATLAEVLEFEADAEESTLPQDRRDDIREVQNYRQAMRQAQDDKAPGELRKIPNWIGPRGCTIVDARFVPISADKLDAAMGSWESFIHSSMATAASDGWCCRSSSGKPASCASCASCACSTAI